MRARRIGAAIHEGGSAIYAVEFPGIEIAEPESSRRTWISGSFSLLVHLSVIAMIFLASYLAPEEILDDAIPVRILNEPPAPKSDPAPAKKALAERRSVNFRPQAQAVTPQVVNPRVVARAAPQVVAQQLEMNAISKVAAPQEVTRSAISVEKVTAVRSTVVASNQVLDVSEVVAPALRGPIEAVAPVGVEAGPRQIVDVGNTTGVGTARLGEGSSVREGIVSNRDVLGSPDGARLADVRSAVGDGYLHGGGGNGEGGVSVDDCLKRPEVQAYWDGIRTRVYARWALPPDVESDQEVRLRFVLDPAGSAKDVEILGSGNVRLGESAVDALRSASPFPPMQGRVRCMAGLPIVGTFRNPLASRTFAN